MHKFIEKAMTLLCKSIDFVMQKHWDCYVNLLSLLHKSIELDLQFINNLIMELINA